MSDEVVRDSATDFDKSPPVEVSMYDSSMRLFFAAYEPLFTMAYSALKSVLSDDTSVLIVGAGTGAEIVEFGKRNSTWKMTGVDPSADMLTIARDRVAEYDLNDRVKLVKGYTSDLPAEPLYDAATCILVMHFLEDDGAKLSILKDISSRLKPGALLVLVDGFGDISTTEFNNKFAAWKQFPVAMGMDQDFVEERSQSILMQRIKFVSESRIFSLLEEAGFVYPERFYTSFFYGGWMAYKG